MTGTPDLLRHALGQWWSDEGLPPLDELSEQDARRALDKIDDLEWSCRPFGSDPDVTR